jgi:hypothetical protein
MRRWIEHEPLHAGGAEEARQRVVPRVLDGQASAAGAAGRGQQVERTGEACPPGGT